MWKDDKLGRDSAEARLLPQIIIRGLKHRTWERLDGANGIEYWLDIFNDSEGSSLESVRAEMVSIEPDLFGYLPIPLHGKHDQTYLAREFSINPGGTGMVDIITGPSGRPICQSVMIIPHTIDGKSWLHMPIGDYVFTIRISGRNIPATQATFKAWVEDGSLRCDRI